MKYELIKRYVSETGKPFEKGRFIDIGSDKAKQLKREGYIADDAEPIKPKTIKSDKKAGKWLAESKTTKTKE